MEHAPHEGRISADKQIERDRAGEQLLAHLSVLVSETRDRDESARIEDSVPLLRASAKYLLTACDRCRRRALLSGKAALLSGDGERQRAARSEVHRFDELMRQVGAQHGFDSPLREMVEAVDISADELLGLGLAREDLFDSGSLLKAS